MEPSGEGVQVGEKAVVGGDVTGGDRTEYKAVGGDVNIHQAAQDDTKVVQSCGVCGETKTQTEGHGACPSCHNWICLTCFVKDQNLCLDCIKKNEAFYSEELAKAYGDGMIEQSERELLRYKAKELKINETRAAELESPFADKAHESGEMSSREKRSLARAKGDLEKWDIKDAVRRLEPLFQEHGKNEKEVREWYFRSLIELDPERASQEVEGFKKELGYDDLPIFMAEIELAIRNGERGKAESVIKHAKKIFGADPASKRIIDIKEIEVFLDAYVDEGDKFDLESAEDALEDLEPENFPDPHECFVRAYLDHANGNENALEHARNDLSQKSVNTFFVRRRIEYLKEKTAQTQVGKIAADYHEYKKYFDENADTVGFLKKNEAKANDWLTAAHKDDDHALIMIADCYLHGIGQNQDSQTAIQLFDYLAKANADPLAQYKLGLLYLEGSEDVPRNEEVGFNYLNDSAQRSLAAAQAMTALCYLEAKGVEENLEKAAEMAQISLESRHKVASYVMGKLCAEGKGVAHDSARAIQYLNDAAKRGYPPAQCLLGEYYAYGLCDVIKSEAKAVELFTLATESDDSRESAHAYMYLGHLFASGIDGGKVDEEKALSCYLKSAELGDPEGQYFYGQIIEGGKLGAQENTKQAYVWYKKAAEQGQVKSLVMMGHAFSSGGMGVPEDLAEAAKCYGRAANKGDGDAGYILGELYKTGGIGVPQDLNKSNEWYQKAADNGHKVAISIVGSSPQETEPAPTQTVSSPVADTAVQPQQAPQQQVVAAAGSSPGEVIMNVLTNNAGMIMQWHKVFVHPSIPADKLQTAMNAVGCPFTEKVYALFDYTFLGSADEALVFTDNAVRFKDDQSGNFYAEWVELAQSQISFNEDIIVSNPQTGIKKIDCQISACEPDWPVVVEMMKQIAAGIAGSAPSVVTNQPAQQQAAPQSFNELVIGAINNFSGMPDTHYHPMIPAKKMNNFRSSVGVPNAEEILLLIDLTTFGSAKDGLALTSAGLRYKRMAIGTFNYDWATLKNCVLVSKGFQLLDPNPSLEIQNPSTGTKDNLSMHPHAEFPVSSLINIISSVTGKI